MVSLQVACTVTELVIGEGGEAGLVGVNSTGTCGAVSRLFGPKDGLGPKGGVGSELVSVVDA